MSHRPRRPHYAATSPKPGPVVTSHVLGELALALRSGAVNLCARLGRDVRDVVVTSPGSFELILDASEARGLSSWKA